MQTAITYHTAETNLGHLWSFINMLTKYDTETALFGWVQLLDQIQNVRKLAGIQPEPNLKPEFSAA